MPLYSTLIVLKFFAVDFRYIQYITFNLLTDINECIEGTSGCQHNCHNNIGSFTCSCNPGYVPPGTNWKSCVGKLMYRLFCVFALSFTHTQFNVMCPGLSTKYSGSLLHPSLSLLTNHVYCLKAYLFIPAST